MRMELRSGMGPAVHPATAGDQLVSRNPRGAVQEKTGGPSSPWVGVGLGLGMVRITNRDRDDLFLVPVGGSQDLRSPGSRGPGVAPASRSGDPDPGPERWQYPQCVPCVSPGWWA